MKSNVKPLRRDLVNIYIKTFGSVCLIEGSSNIPTSIVVIYAQMVYPEYTCMSGYFTAIMSKVIQSINRT